MYLRVITMRKKLLLFIFLLMLCYGGLSIGFSTWIITTESTITPNYSGQAEITIDNYNKQSSIYDGKRIADAYLEDDSDVKLPKELQTIVSENYKQEFVYQSIDNEGNIVETLAEKPRNAGEYKITIVPKDEAVYYEKIEIEYTIKPRVIELEYGYNDGEDVYLEDSSSDIRKEYDGKQTTPIVRVNNLQKDEEGNIDICDLVYEWGTVEEDNIVSLSSIKDYTSDAYIGKILSKSNDNYTFESDDDLVNSTNLDFSFKIEKRVIDIKWSDQLQFIYNGLEVGLEASVNNLVEGDEVEIVVGGGQTNANALYNSSLEQDNYLLSGKQQYFAKAIEITGDDINNYTLPDEQLCEKEYIITQALLSMTANDNAITYGDLASNNGVTYEGFVNNEDETNVPSLYNVTYEYTYDNNFKEKRVVGEYKIIPSYESEYTNYYVEINNGTLTVEQLEVTLSWENTSSLIFNGTALKPDAYVSNKPYVDDDVNVLVSGEQTDTNNKTSIDKYIALASLLTGIDNGNYVLPNEESCKQQFIINQRDISGIVITLSDGEDFVYRFNQIKPDGLYEEYVNDVNIIKADDYDISYGNNIFANEDGSVTLTGKGNYKGIIVETFDIKKRLLTYQLIDSPIENELGLYVIPYASDYVKPEYELSNIAPGEISLPTLLGLGEQTESTVNSRFESVSLGTQTSYTYQVIGVDNNSDNYTINPNEEDSLLSSRNVTVYQEDEFHIQQHMATLLVSEQIDSDESTLVNDFDASSLEFIYIYNGYVQTPYFKINNVLGEDEVVVNVSSEEQMIDAGTDYEISVNTLLSTNNNYEIPSENILIPYVIKPKEITVNWIESAGLYDTVYDGINREFNIYPTVDSICETDDFSDFVIETQLLNNDVVVDNIKNANTNTQGVKLSRNDTYLIQAINVIENGIVSNNYILPSAGLTQEFVIRQAPLTIKVSDLSVTYGDNIYLTTNNLSADGFVTGEDFNNLNGTLSYLSNYDTSREQSRNVGEYFIFASGYDKEGNYEINYIETVFNVLEREITVSSVLLTVTYNGYTQTPKNIKFDNLVYEDEVNPIFDKQYKDANIYTVTLTTVDNANYKINPVVYDNFEIEKAELYITVDSTDIYYGDSAPDYFKLLSIDGFVGEDDVNDLDGYETLQVSCDYDTTNILKRGHGKYDIIAPQYTSQNYNMNINNGLLTVNRKSLTITLSSQTLTYNGQVQIPEFTVIGFVYDETIEDIKKQLLFSQEIRLAQTYNDVTVNVLDECNYTFDGYQFSLTVNPKPIDINWAIPTLIYNGQYQSISTEYISLTGVYEEDNVGLSVSGDGKDANINNTKYTASATISNTNYVFSDTNTNTTTTQYIITPRDVTYNWDMEDEYIYSGSHQSPTILFEGLVYEDVINVTYNYTQNGNVINEAVDAGNYSVQAINFTNTNYNVLNANEAVQAYTIEKKEVHALLVSSSAEWSGKPIIPAVNITNNISSNPCEYELSYEQNGIAVAEMIEIGTYTVIVNVIDSNYKLVQDQYINHNFEITKATYPTENIPTIGILHGKEGMSLNDVKFATYSEGRFEWVNGSIILENTGSLVYTYQAIFYPFDEVHYNSVTVDVNVTIDDMTYITVTLGSQTYPYDGNAHTLIPSVDVDIDLEEIATLTWSYGSNHLTSGFIDVNTGNTLVTLQIKIKDEYASTYGLNNANGDGVLTLVSNLTITPITTGIVWSDLEQEWNGSILAPTIKFTQEIKASDCNPQFSYVNNNTGEKVSEMKEVGNYAVTIISVSSNYIVDTTALTTNTFTITKATPDYVTITGLTGKAGNKLSSIDLSAYEGFAWMNPDEVISESGEVTFLAKYTPSDINHYKVVENIEITVNVESIKIYVSTEDKEVSYNGTPHTLIPVIKDEFDNVISASDYASRLNIITYYGDSSNTTGYINANTKGTSDVYITVSVIGSYYIIINSGSEVSSISLENQLVVNPIKLDITWDQTTYEYSGSIYTPTITIDKSNVISGDNINYTLTGGNGGRVLEAGDYSFTAKSTNPNYEFNDSIKIIKVTPKPVTYTWSNSTFEFNTTHQAPTIIVDGGNIIDSAQYQITDESGNIIDKSVNAGAYTIKVVGWTNKNYSISPASGYTDSVTYTIGKAAPTFASTITLQSIYFSGSVSDSDIVILNNGSPSTPGTFELITDLNTITINASTYNDATKQTSSTLKFTFTPIDQTNYKPIEVEVKLYINVVAYSDQTKTYYSYVEKALEVVTSGTVYILPGSNPTISSNCEVKSGVTLALPYANSGTTFEVFNRAGINKVYADSTIELVNTNRRLNVTIADGVTLTVNGTLNVGGVLGSQGQGLSGHTSGFYAQITMNDDSKIISNGTIWSQGYIKESSLDNGSSIDINSGNIYAPFVIYDYRGGSSTSGVYKGSGGPISPFSQYDMPNVHPTITLKYGTKYVGLVSLYTGETSVLTATIKESYNASEVTVIGNGGILVPSNKATVCVKYDSYFENGQPLTVNDDIHGTTTVDIYGGASFGSMTLKVEAEVTGLGASIVESLVNTTIDTQTVLFPINWRYSFNLYDGTYTIDNPIKFLPGSSLYVSPTATLNITNQTIFYSEIESHYNDTVSIVPGCEYPSDKGGARFVLDGTANISGAFGGYIETTNNTGRLILSSNTLTMSSKEGYGSRDGTTLTFHVIQTITEKARGNVYDSSTISDKAELTTGVYYSTGTAWESHNDPINITYDYVFVDCDEVSEITNSNASQLSPTGSMSLKEPVIDDSLGLVFDGWYLTADCSGQRVTHLNGLDLSGDITLYGKWVAGEKYTLTYVYYTGADVVLSGASSNTESHDYLAGSTQIVEDLMVTKEGYIFTHWGTDSGRESDSGDTYIPGSLIDITSDITLYAKYTITQYSVDLSANGGTFSDGTILKTETVNYKGSITLPSGLTKDGYTFQGWSTNSSATSGSTGSLSNIKSDTTLYAAWKEDGGCIAAGTLITLADGTYKKVEDLTGEELLLVFNHETGKYDYVNIIFVDNDGWKDYRILNLVFSDGTTLKVIYSHGFFDLDLNKYVYIDYSNVNEYIGHRFHKGTFDGINYNSEIITLVDAYETIEYTGCYSPVTVYHLNYYTNDLLSMPAGIEGLFNIFEYDENMKYDETLMQQDIEKYGLYTYADFEAYLPEEIYNLFPAPYFKVSVGKGYITFEGIVELIDKYLNTMLEQNGLT